MAILKRKPAVTAGVPTAAEKSWIPILADWKKGGLGGREFCRHLLWANAVGFRRRRRAAPADSFTHASGIVLV